MWRARPRASARLIEARSGFGPTHEWCEEGQIVDGRDGVGRRHARDTLTDSDGVLTQFRAQDSAAAGRATGTATHGCDAGATATHGCDDGAIGSTD